jgi:hypothetical protein
MPYLNVSNFKGGLDVRRSQEASASGLLFEAKNVHVTRGGELEKRMAFVPVLPLPPETRSLAATAYNLYTFAAHGRSPALDPGMLHVSVELSPWVGLKRVLDVDVFGGKIYASVEYDDGTITHWYDGVRVPNWTSPPEALPPAGGAIPTGALQRYGPILTLSGKMYAGAQNFLFFSKIDDPTEYVPTVPNTGQGYIDLSNSYGGSERLVAFAAYQGKLAVFTRKSVQIWDVDPDPANMRLRQVLTNIGTRAQRSVINFGDTDVFFLADSGVRSLRARDSSNNASTSDIGTPVDPLIVADMLALSDKGVNAQATIEPSSGRYWLALGSKIYVFSFYPSSKVSAWTRYELPFEVDSFAQIEQRLYVRGKDNWLYLYGGADGQTYGNDYECTVELALLDAGKPATMKQISGIDVGCEGSWAVRLGTDPTQPDTRELIATVSRSTFGMERVAAQGYGSHFSYELRHQGPGRAALHSLATHFDVGEQD